MSRGKWILGTLLAASFSIVAVSYAEQGDEESGPRDAPPRREGPMREGPRDRPPRPDGRPGPEAIYKEIDANGDGNVTMEEFVQHHKERFGNRPPGPPQGRRFGPPRGGNEGRRGFGPPPPPQEGERLGPPREGRRFQDRGRGPRDRGLRDRGSRSMGPPPCPHCQGSGMAPPPPRGGDRDYPRPPRGERPDRYQPERDKPQRDRPAAEQPEANVEE